MAKARPKHPTINDVAERAGVSKSLVSLVMRGSPNVSDERRSAVLEAARELRYRPNAAARSLVRQRSGVFGVVLSDLHNPFFADVADGIEEGAMAAGYRALLASGFLDAERERTAVDTLLQLRVDGLILLGNVGAIGRFESAALAVPTAIVSRETPSKLMDSVMDDDRLGATMLVDHLVELGHRRIAHISPGSAAGGPGRRRGYEERMRHHGLEAEITIVDGAFTLAGGRTGMETLLAMGPRPTAVMAPNDFAAIGALETADAAGLAVPDDVSVTGYDNIALARLPRIGLTTIAQPAAELGRTAVALLRERVEENRTEARHLVIEPTLVVGGTTGPPRSDDAP
jgi:DNA-binding LacI/PurR family transcriptional regulator